ncbi:MAG TPA: gephyrin-like molybdotransferase Glp [Acidimicrobiales bacterium]|nr:gephyrin-like molybdotransferase Glp [Acidimicrobiales bacterium]
MIPLDEATAHVLAGCPPLASATTPVGDAAGCVLAGPVAAREDVPEFANTAMDGYAVRAADLAEVPVTLPVVGQVAAGHPADHPLGAGEAMRIFTGAVMPQGADAVVMVERTERRRTPDGGDAVEIGWVAEVGDHVRPAGGDLRAGDAVFAAGDELTPARLGVLASLGVTEVEARPRPRVGVLSTGDELVEPGVALRPGQIRDSNRPTLLALVAAAGFTPVDLGRAPDDEAAITAALERGVAGCDAVLSSGGVSMGDTDLVKVVLDRLGDMRWMQVAIRPAKPLAFGVVPADVGTEVDGDERRVPVFGLPGNPVSSMVSFELFARPALRRLAGHPADRLHRPRLAAVADEALPRRPDGKLHLARVLVGVDADGRLHVRSAGGQGSHQLAAASRADGLALLPDGDGVAAGDPVTVVLLGDPPALAG